MTSDTMIMVSSLKISQSKNRAVKQSVCVASTIESVSMNTILATSPAKNVSAEKMQWSS